MLVLPVVGQSTSTVPAYSRSERHSRVCVDANVSVGGSCRLPPTADGWAAVSCAAMSSTAIPGQPSPTGFAPTAAPNWPNARNCWESPQPPLSLASTLPPIPTPLHPRPVDGLLVADFSALWVGPLCAHLLGLAGARVVKVETPTRPNGARRGNPDFFRLLHGGHESVVLDPVAIEGRRALAALVDSADVVIAASPAPVLSRVSDSTQTPPSPGVRPGYRSPQRDASLTASVSAAISPPPLGLSHRCRRHSAVRRRRPL